MNDYRVLGNLETETGVLNDRGDHFITAQNSFSQVCFPKSNNKLPAQNMNWDKCKVG